MGHVYDTSRGPQLTSLTNAHAIERGDQIILPHLLGTETDLVTVTSTTIDRADRRNLTMTVHDGIGPITMGFGINTPIPRVVGGRHTRS